jgi:hypothetical protein
MFVPAKSSTILRGAMIAAVAATSLLIDALADPPRREGPANASRPVAARVAKCICGHGVDGYEGLTCVPVKDCEWERGVCRGKC